MATGTCLLTTNYYLLLTTHYLLTTYSLLTHYFTIYYSLLNTYYLHRLQERTLTPEQVDWVRRLYGRDWAIWQQHCGGAIQEPIPYCTRPEPSTSRSSIQIRSHSVHAPGVAAFSRPFQTKTSTIRRNQRSGRYIVAAINQNDCPSGWGRLTNAKVCRTAARELGMITSPKDEVFINQNNPARPNGCFRWFFGSVHFNTRNDSLPAGPILGAPVCKNLPTHRVYDANVGRHSYGS